jgi:hypothetical protein
MELGTESCRRRVHDYGEGTLSIVFTIEISNSTHGRLRVTPLPLCGIVCKERVVTQVARQLLAAFQQRFDETGSLYLSRLQRTTNRFFVGTIVSSTFFQLEDGLPVYPDPHVADGLQPFRGPFSNGADILCGVKFSF